MNQLIWLASYPKSGNTWFRVFFENYMRVDDEPADINALDESHGIASSRVLFDECAGIPASDLTHDEADQIRPDVYEVRAKDEERMGLVKIHDAYSYLPDKTPMFGGKGIKCAIYLLRNPLDVAVSFAHHSGKSVEYMGSNMSNPDQSMCGSTKRLHNQLRQKMHGWSAHILSWVDAPEIPVHVMRYEDMKREPIKTFKSALEFAGFEGDEKRITRALRLSDFKELKRQETEKGFGEKSPKAKSFFRKGEIGSYQQSLSKEQIAQICADNGEVMRRFGYLNERGEIVV